MHESFDKDDPTHFTRKWFAWANTLFGELVLKVRAERPHLLKGGCRPSGLRGLVQAGQVHLERRAATGSAVDADAPAVAFDDAVHGGEAQAQARAFGLRREEGLEDALPRLLVHADPLSDRPPSRSARAAPGVGAAGDLDVARLDGQGPPRGMASRALRARFTSCSISVTSARRAPAPGPRGSPPEVLADHPLQHAVELRHHRVEVRRQGSVGQPAAEGEQPAVQRGGALGRVKSRGEPGEGRVIGAEQRRASSIWPVRRRGGC